MEIVNRGIAVHGVEGSQRQSCAFPGIAVLPGGRWLCGLRGAPFKSADAGQAPLLSISDDEGATWSEPVIPTVPPELDGRPGVFRAFYPTSIGGSNVIATLMWCDHSDPTLPLFNPETEGILDSYLFQMRSSDNGDTWSAPELISRGDFDVPLAVTGPILVLPNGDWVNQFEVNKHYYETTVWRHSSVLTISTDKGETWTRNSVASNDPENRVFYWDQRPAVVGDDHILDFFWTYDNQAAAYLNIHARETRDGGRTWGPMWDTGLPGQPAPVVRLNDDRLALVYVDRTAAPTLKVRTSSDGGHTWPEATELVLHQLESPSQTWEKGKMQDAWAEMGKFSLGLPAATRLPNGDVLVVYYAGPHTDHTHIHWVRLSV